MFVLEKILNKSGNYTTKKGMKYLLKIIKRYNKNSNYSKQDNYQDNVPI